MITRTSTTRWPIAATLGLAYAGFALPSLAQSLDCPVAQVIPGQGILKESPLQIVETGSFLASSASANRASEVVADLRKRYPSVSDAEIENYLITAYCPVVAKLNGLSVAEQRARVNQFAHQASVAVHGN